jgi:hypothetical protein
MFMCFYFKYFPYIYGFVFIFTITMHSQTIAMYKHLKIMFTMAGFEPAIFWSVDKFFMCSLHAFFEKRAYKIRIDLT